MLNVTDTASEKIWAFEKLEAHLNAVHGKKLILAGGCFDILHYGHLVFLKQARAKGDILLIALEPDDFIQKVKKKIPVHTQSQRAELLAELACVSAVILLPFFGNPMEYNRLVSTIKPAGIAVTEGDPKLSEKNMQAQSVAAKIYEFPVIKPFSSSLIHQYEIISRDRTSSAGKTNT